MLVTQSCLTLCNHMDHSPPGPSFHGILQARILEFIAISFSRGSSQPRDRTQVSHIAGRLFTIWATRKAQLWGKCTLNSHFKNEYLKHDPFVAKDDCSFGLFFNVIFTMFLLRWGGSKWYAFHANNKHFMSFHIIHIQPYQVASNHFVSEVEISERFRASVI